MQEEKKSEKEVVEGGRMRSSRRAATEMLCRLGTEAAVERGPA